MAVDNSARIAELLQTISAAYDGSVNITIDGVPLAKESGGNLDSVKSTLDLIK